MVLRRLPTAICRSQRRCISIKNNPYKVKRPWPPDYAKLPPNYQLRLERRYRRRSKLKWLRPGFVKAVKVAQFVTISFVIVYGVLFMEAKSPRGENPFRPLREWFHKTVDSFWSQTSSEAKLRSDGATK